jgi:exopolysaccharide production protein ExoZ
MTAERTGDHRNISLQALRGIAACAVVVHHAAGFTSLRAGAPWLAQLFGGQLGFYGVLVFFVLSGYLMEGAVRRYDAKTFALHRFARLYPTYWVICAVFFLVQSFRMGAWESIPWNALTLLPLGDVARPLAVEWTLVYEVFFYFVCALLCFWRRVYLVFNLVWLAIVATAVLKYSQSGQLTIDHVPFNAWNVAFICGGLAGRVNRSIKSSDGSLLCLAGIALLLLGQLVDAVANLFLLAPGTACLLLALVRSESRLTRSPGLVLRALFLLGECSYGLYLAHCLAIQIALQYVSPARLMNPISVFVGMIGVGLTVGLLAGGMDVILYRRLKSWIDRRIRSPVSVPTITALQQDAESGVKANA